MRLSKEILEGCIVEWYGSVNELELSVRTKVRDSFIEQVTRFPMGYQWLVTCLRNGSMSRCGSRRTRSSNSSKFMY